MACEKKNQVTDSRARENNIIQDQVARDKTPIARRIPAESRNERPAKWRASQSTKVPKLVIIKFNGSFMDWPRFWSQFSEPIDKSSVLPVTKFTYLRELLDDRAKKTMEALPHSPEGYNVAKAIMKEQFGKESKITKAYVKKNHQPA